LSSLLTLLASTAISALDNGVAVTPPMGWRSWNQFGQYFNFVSMEFSLPRVSSAQRLRRHPSSGRLFTGEICSVCTSKLCPRSHAKTNNPNQTKTLHNNTIR
jgi:hypothetical protein